MATAACAMPRPRSPSTLQSKTVLMTWGSRPTPGGHPRPAHEVRRVGHVDETGLAKDGGCGLALSIRVLHDQPTSRAKQPPCGRSDVPDDVQPVPACHQREAGI